MGEVTVCFGHLGSLLLSLTVVPLAASYLLNAGGQQTRGAHGSTAVA